MSESAKWYVVHTYSGYENKVAATIQKTVENRHLEDLIFDIRVPMENVTELRDNGEKKEVERKMFPGYVLIKMVMNDDSWYVVRNTRGVTSFVGPGSKPVPLTDEEIEGLALETRSVPFDLSIGDTVRICEGPLADFVGEITQINEAEKKFVVVVSMFGRETPVELEFGQAELLD